MENIKIKQLVNKLYKIKCRLSNFSAIAGFDGFIDIITRPIASGNSTAIKSYYNNIADFASFISQRAGNSSSIELVELNRKLGGNAPIFANALGRLGVSTTCIGAFGYPEIEYIFKDISENCKLISVAIPGTCTSLEFDDGKVMLAINREINSMDWDMITSHIGIDRLRSLFKKSHLIGLFDWSEIPLAEDIWTNIIQDILPYINMDKRVIFDFSDSARREEQRIHSMLNIVREFGKQISTTVSMNENEANAILRVMDIDEVSMEISGELLRQALTVENIIWHFRDYTLGFSKDGIYRFETYKIEKPLVTTGDGDNFNAGLGLGLLSGLTLDESIMIASLTASYYVYYGSSPSLDELVVFIKDHTLQNDSQIYERKDVCI